MLSGYNSRKWQTDRHTLHHNIYNILIISSQTELHHNIYYDWLWLWFTSVEKRKVRINVTNRCKKCWFFVTHMQKKSFFSESDLFRWRHHASSLYIDHHYHRRPQRDCPLHQWHGMQNSNKLLSEPVFLLLANVSASNIAISIFVKLMSVILCG